MSVIIGSARIGENGKATGGANGDQKQTTKPDYKGEVSMQEFYIPSKGWFVFRPIKDTDANAIAERMETACNNPNIGYDQNGRLGVVNYGVATKTKTEADCSSLVRECVKEATGKDPGNFTTDTEVAALTKTGLFKDKIAYTQGTELYTGDVLVTKTKGHTAIVTSGKARKATTTTTTTTAKKTATQDIPQPTLRKGIKGTEVKKLQKVLNKLKIYDDDGKKLEEDGDFGKKTEQSVKRMQKKAKIIIDGIYGNDSKAALIKLLG